MKIAFAAGEVVPFAKTGGLGDVSGALPRELEKLGEEVKVFMPKYFGVDNEVFDIELITSISPMKITVAGTVYDVSVHKSTLPDSQVEIYFMDCPHFFHRTQFYTDDWDEDQRFICFSKAVIETLQRLGWAPDVIHCNDWQTGLIPLYIKENYAWDKLFEHTSSLFTIHNIGYQGKFLPKTIANAEIDPGIFYKGGRIEQDGLLNFLKAGISFSDVINTVSKKYAEELLTPEYSYGMDTVLQYRQQDFYGVLNGVDYSVWNPETDKLIPFNYSIKNLSGKEKNKKKILEEFSMPYKKDTPLFGIVSRFAIQKGFDLIFDAMDDLMKMDIQFVILGSGEKKYENMLRRLNEKMPDKIGVYVGYNEELAHSVEASADMFLMASRYEPCGLNQIYSLKYGTIPVVRKTGGLADTVQDWNKYTKQGLDTGTGFSFEDYDVESLLDAVQRAVNTYNDKPAWKKIQLNGMKKDFSWENSAKLYKELYQKANSKR